mmetsp:Transcript_3278/g.10030  ORF Transcript_3278/g.10030 Transcript_3278/m.10030 type:complete len:413 (-) Transcript_3278:233-1471(-)
MVIISRVKTPKRQTNEESFGSLSGSASGSGSTPGTTFTSAAGSVSASGASSAPAPGFAPGAGSTQVARKGAAISEGDKYVSKGCSDKPDKERKSQGGAKRRRRDIRSLDPHRRPSERTSMHPPPKRLQLNAARPKGSEPSSSPGSEGSGGTYRTNGSTNSDRSGRLEANREACGSRSIDGDDEATNSTPPVKISRAVNFRGDLEENTLPTNAAAVPTPTAGYHPYGSFIRPEVPSAPGPYVCPCQDCAHTYMFHGSNPHYNGMGTRGHGHSKESRLAYYEQGIEPPRQMSYDMMGPREAYMRSATGAYMQRGQYGQQQAGPWPVLSLEMYGSQIALLMTSEQYAQGHTQQHRTLLGSSTSFPGPLTSHRLDQKWANMPSLAQFETRAGYYPTAAAAAAAAATATGTKRGARC